MTLKRSYMRRSCVKLRQWYDKHPADTRSRVRQDLDSVVSKIVRLRDGRCVTCGTTEGLTASHFYRRGWMRTRWDLRNVACQCAPCNALHSINPWPLTNFMLERYGDGVIHELFELRNTRGKMTDGELSSLLADLKLELKKF